MLQSFSMKKLPIRFFTGLTSRWAIFTHVHPLKYHFSPNIPCLHFAKKICPSLILLKFGEEDAKSARSTSGSYSLEHTVTIKFDIVNNLSGSTLIPIYWQVKTWWCTVFSFFNVSNAQWSFRLNHFNFNLCPISILE